MCRSALGVGVAVAMLILSPSRIGNAQPAPGASTPANTGPRDAARKLVKDGIAAQDAKDYDRAIALYLKAFSLDPHPLLLFNVGQAHRLAGCSERAVPFYERYLALEPRGTQAAAARAALDEIRRAANPDGPHCATVAAADEAAGATPAASLPGRLKLRSLPEGVVVMVDGVKIGVTPVEHELTAGAHTIVLVDRGMLVGEQKIEIDAGEVVELTMPVEYPPDGDRYRSSPAGPSRILPISLFVDGGLMIVGSGVAFYLGQKGGRDHPEDPYIYRGATPAGFALAGAGAAAIGVGVWLWMRGSQESAPVAAISSDGSYFGWQGRF